ncbi:hypothetical protein BD408DRAFT_367666 [Parasitella parasitica]|nr:hypothetical protein BD408DRAFT_367666 [Parasitella parasitica]
MIGPTIPEAVLKKPQKEAEVTTFHSDDEEEEHMPTAGPQIPAHLLEKKRQSNSEEVDSEAIGPQMPLSLGPQIPQHIFEQKKSTSTINTDEIAISDDEDIEAGPQIPQHIVDQKKSTEEEDPNDFAPALPPDLLEQRQKQQQQPNQRPAVGRRRRPVGPSLPSGPIPSSTDDDDFLVGPALPKDYNVEEEAKYSAIQAIEERARSTKEAMEQKEADKNKVERPAWMLVPPEVDYLKNASSGKSRQFTNKTMAPEDLDSSGWTETPAEKQRRLEEQRLGKRKAPIEDTGGPSELDIERHRNVQQYNMQTRPLTLLEMHQQKKKKDRRQNGLSAEEDVTKRAFDREKDLVSYKKINKKDKDEFLRKSAELGSKFGYGKSSFL